MPMKMGVKPEVVHGNIREMIKAGHPQKQAIAAALSMKRKSMKKMKDGGMIDDDMDEGAGSDFNENANVGLMEHDILGKVRESSVENPEYQDAQKRLAKHLFEASERGEHGYAEGGLVIGEAQLPVGSKPELDWINDGTEEPMSAEPAKPASMDHAEIEGVPMGMGLSEDAKKAIEERKKKRRFAMS